MVASAKAEHRGGARIFMVRTWKIERNRETNSTVPKANEKLRLKIFEANWNDWERTRNPRATSSNKMQERKTHRNDAKTISTENYVQSQCVA